MEILKKIDAGLMFVIQPVLVAIGLCIAVLLVVGITSRALVGNPIFGLEEIMLIGAMWFYMLGASLASRERSHLSADFVKVISKDPRVWRIAAITATAISLAVAIMFVTWAWDMFYWGLQKGQTTPVFGIPWVVSQSSLFFAAVLFVIYLARDLIHDVFGHSASSDDSTKVEVE